MTSMAVTGNSQHRPSRRRRLFGRNNQNLWFWLFVSPFLIGLVIFIIVPIGWSVYLSFYDARATVSPTEWVGLTNYTTMLGDPAFVDSLKTFAAFAVFIVPTTYVASLATAILVSRATWFQAFFRSVFFLPVACSYVVAALIWRMSIFSGNSGGLVNALFSVLGFDTVAFIAVKDPPWYWLVLVSARLWLQIGFYMIIFLAGLHRINPVLYEAAAIDGATAWQTFRYITLPQLQATSQAVLLLLLINAFQAFDEFFNILSNFNGYPPYARPPLVYLYITALGDKQDFGRGSAGAVVLAVIIVAVAVGVNQLFKLRIRRSARR